jgi:hypothetical protein
MFGTTSDFLQVQSRFIEGEVKLLKESPDGT